ncbi:MAG TPA: holo-ACP synthase [Clostridiales bacterium]|nr:holo-ACP synthase [Clostridiales bacterium]
MLSVGIDLIEIDRIKQSVENQKFISRVFGEHEQFELLRKQNNIQSYAAAFAAKEAFAKALGTGFRGFSLNEIELLHDELGAPYLKLSGRALEIAEEKRLRFSVSVTHTDNYAAAVVVAEKYV